MGSNEFPRSSARTNETLRQALTSACALPEHATDFRVSFREAHVTARQKSPEGDVTAEANVIAEADTTAQTDVTRDLLKDMKEKAEHSDA